MTTRRRVALIGLLICIGFPLLAHLAAAWYFNLANVDWTTVGRGILTMFAGYYFVLAWQTYTDERSDPEEIVIHIRADTPVTVGRATASVMDANGNTVRTTTWSPVNPANNDDDTAAGPVKK